MAGEIANAYVRIRPNMQGFREQVNLGVRESLRGVGGLVAGAFAVAGIGEFVKKTAEAAATQQASLVAIRRAVQANNDAWIVNGKTVTQSLEDQARVAGTSVPELAQGFLRLETQTKNSAKALHDLGLAEDIAVARHMQVAQAAIALARAEGGNQNSLRRLGITIPPITAAQDRLKNARNALIAQGAKFTAQNNAELAQRLAVAKAQDKQATITNILAQVQERFGGQAAAFGRTAAGSYDRFRESVRQLEVSIGEQLLPALTSAANTLIRWVDELRTSQSVHNAVASAAHAVGSGIAFIRASIVAVQPILGAFARTLEALGGAVGLAPLIAGFAAFKGAKIAIGAADAALTLWDKAIIAGTASQAAATTSQEASTVATAANTVATEANTAAHVANDAAVVASEGVLGSFAVNLAETSALMATGFRFRNIQTGGFLTVAEGVRQTNAAIAEQIAIMGGGTAGATAYEAALLRMVAVQELVAGGNARLAASFVLVEDAEVEATTAGVGTFVRGLFSMINPMTAVVVGVGALAAGLYFLSRRETEAEKSSKNLGDRLAGLGASMKSVASDQAALNQLQQDLPTQRLAVQTAKLNVAEAQHALNTSKALPGSLQWQQLENQLAQARDQLRRSTDDLNNAELQRGATSSRLRVERQQDIAQGERATAAAMRAVRSLEDQAEHSAKYANDFDKAVRDQHIGWTQQALDTAKAIVGLKGFNKELESQAAANEKNFPVLARNIRALEEYGRTIGRIPDQHIIHLFLTSPNVHTIVASLLDNFRVAGMQAGAQFMQGLQQMQAQFGGKEPGLTDRLQLLERLQRVTGQIPSRKVTTLVLDASSFKVAVQEIVLLLDGMDQQAKRHGYASGNAWAQAFIAQLKSAGFGDQLGALGQSFADQIAANTAADVALAQSAVANAIATLKTAKDQLHTANEALTTARTTAAQSLQTLKDDNQRLADAIKQGRQSVLDAISGAEQNLASIGQSLDQTLDKFLTAQSTTVKATAAERAQARELRREIAHGTASPDARQRAAALAAQMQTENAIKQRQVSMGTDQSTRLQRRINDQIALFREGLLSPQQLYNRITKILAGAGLTVKTAAKKLGVAFSLEFQGELKGLFGQATAIAATPAKLRSQVAGGFVPSITKPLDAIHSAQESIASAQQARDNARLQVQKDQRALQDAIRKQGEAAAKEATQQKVVDRLTAALAAARIANRHAKDIAANTKNTHNDTKRIVTELANGVKVKGGIVLSPVPGAIPGAGGELRPGNNRRVQVVPSTTAAPAVNEKGSTAIVGAVNGSSGKLLTEGQKQTRLLRRIHAAQTAAPPSAHHSTSRGLASTNAKNSADHLLTA